MVESVSLDSASEYWDVFGETGVLAFEWGGGVSVDVGYQ